MTLTHAGLFEGYGGTTMAAEQALGPLATRWYSDIKPASIALLEHCLPGVPNLGDMTAIDYAAAPRVDVLTASWPCQPHSSAGKRLGEADPRALWPHVARAVEQVRPAIFLGENVARVAGNGELRRVVRSLADLGYVGAWRCVRASDVGAPHRRDRCFVVAVDPAADALGLVVRDEPGRRGGPDGAGAGIAGHDGPQRKVRAADGVTLLPTPRQRDWKGRDSAPGGGPSRPEAVALLKTPTTNLGSNGGSQHPDKRKAGGHGPTLADEVEWLLPTPSVADSRNTRNATAGRSEGASFNSGWTLSDVAYAERWGVYADAVRRWERVLGRAAPAPTMPSPRGGAARPVLSPAFVEWMMGLPAGHVVEVPGLSRTAHLSLLGDGVVPQQGAHAYRWMLADLAARLTTPAAA